MFGVPLDTPAPLLIDRNVPSAVGALTILALPSLGLVSGAVAEVAYLCGLPTLLLSLTAWASNRYSIRRRDQQLEEQATQIEAQMQEQRAYMEAHPELHRNAPYVPGPRVPGVLYPADHRPADG